MIPPRSPVADPAFMRKGARRLMRAGLVLLVLLTGFSAGGIAMLRSGELPGLPFAVGGLTAQIAVVAIVAAGIRARYTLRDGTIATRALIHAREIFRHTGRALLIAGVSLVTYGLVRAVLGDMWTLLTAVVIAFALTLLYVASLRLKRGISGQIQQLEQTDQGEGR